MQTEYELCYDRFVISNISHLVISAKERISLLLDFLKKRQANYDLLCELSYVQALGKSYTQSLWLTPFGEPYLSEASRSAEDICLISYENIVPLQDDMSAQLQMIRQAMQTSALFTE